MSSNKVIEIKKPSLKTRIMREIAERFSPHVFSLEPIPDEEIRSFFEAARWAPSARNRQPWFFYYTKHKERSFEKICSTLYEFNYWARHAPILVVACVIDEDENGRNSYALYDLGGSITMMILQAQHMGYYARQIGAFDKEKLSKTLLLPKNHNPFVIIALGKIGDYTTADKKSSQFDFVPRQRKLDISKRI